MAKVKLIKTTTSDPSRNSSNMKSYVGFSTVNRDFDSSTLYNYELARTDLLNNLYIKKGEKLENPDYGTVVWNLLFEPFTSQISKVIEEDMIEMVENDPRWHLETLQIEQEEHGLNITLEIQYVPYNISEKMSLLFNESTGLSIESLGAYEFENTIEASANKVSSAY